MFHLIMVRKTLIPLEKRQAKPSKTLPASEDYCSTDPVNPASGIYNTSLPSSSLFKELDLRSLRCKSKTAVLVALLDIIAAVKVSAFAATKIR